MSLKPRPSAPVPELTAQVAHAAFPDGNPYSSSATPSAPSTTTNASPTCSPTGTARRVPLAARPGHRPPVRRGAPRPPGRRRRPRPHRLEVRPRPGADRPRLRLLRPLRVPLPAPGRRRRNGSLLEAMLETCKAHGLVKPRGKQRTDSTHVLAAIRTLNRLELVGETLRAALNGLATVEPEWLRSWAPPEWFDRYSTRVEESRLPKGRGGPLRPRRGSSAATATGCSRPSPAADAPAGLWRGAGRRDPPAGLALPVLPRGGPGALAEGG